MTTTARTTALVLLGAVTLLPPAWSAQALDETESVLAKCAELMGRKPARYHIQGYEVLAGAKDERAMAVLRKAYSRPAFPEGQTPYLIASAVGEKGSGDGVLGEFADWLEEAKKPRDAWLWRNILNVELDYWGPNRALEFARTSEEIVLRAAAIEALAAEKDASLYRLIPELCKALPNDDVEKTILMGAMVTALAELGDEETRVEGDWQQMALSLIATMEEGRTPRRAQLMLARYLTAELDADRMVLEPDAWRSLIATRAREAKKKRAHDKKVPKRGEDAPAESVVVWPTFFGVEVTGERVCYLIDLSDSMATPIPESWKPNGPTSGPKKRKKWKKGEVPTEKDIPWWSVKTRFDLAREHLRISLLRMAPEQHFSVIGFGSKAEFLKGCNGMVKATPANIKRVLKAVDSIEVGEPTANRQHGVLWGDTNLFDGLRLAFSATAKGAVKTDAYVSYDAMEYGADTIMILSDGNPSVDNFSIVDVDFGDGRALADVESGADAKTRSKTMNYMGPYADWEGLLKEATRLNMFREAQIQVISVGDGDRIALALLAEIGLGELTELGKN